LGLDEQLTEDADGAGRQLKLARDHWVAVAHCCYAFPEKVIGRHHTDSSTPKKPEKYGVSTRTVNRSRFSAGVEI